MIQRTSYEKVKETDAAYVCHTYFHPKLGTKNSVNNVRITKNEIREAYGVSDLPIYSFKLFTSQVMHLITPL